MYWQNSSGFAAQKWDYACLCMFHHQTMFQDSEGRDFQFSLRAKSRVLRSVDIINIQEQEGGSKLKKVHVAAQECSMSNSPSCSLTRNITSYSMKTLAFHSYVRWKVINMLQLSLPHLYISLLKGLANVLFELGSHERVERSPSILSGKLNQNLTIAHHSISNGYKRPHPPVIQLQWWGYSKYLVSITVTR